MLAPGEPHGRPDVGDSRASRNQPRTPGSIEPFHTLAALVVAGIGRAN